VKSQLTANLYVEARLLQRKEGASVRWRIGARNITDEKPPLTSEGYLGSLYNPYGRYIYTSLTTEL
jgi:iron complex outermembrane receptor protein